MVLMERLWVVVVDTSKLYNADGNHDGEQDNVSKKRKRDETL